MAVIDKFDAAERLIGGVGMSEGVEDPLAIPLVASSALNLLSEPIQANGDNYSAGVLREALFEPDQSLARDGRL